MAARRALLDRAGPEHDRVGSSAFRADETPRPAPREQRCPTLFLGAILQPKRRFAQTLLELHNVLGHPNLPQSLSSSSLYHPPRKLKFVGNQEGFLSIHTGRRSWSAKRPWSIRCCPPSRTPAFPATGG